MSKYIKFFSELNNKNVPQVGGKNASLGEMYGKLTSKGVRVPNGFATTAYAYDYFMKEAGLKNEIRKILKGLDTHNMNDLMKRGAEVRKTIIATEFPKDLEEAIVKAYEQLSKEYKVANLDVAVRSSATAEDLPDASFAGQQETYLNIKGEKYILIAVKKCVASLFTNRAISYRVDKGFDHFKIALSVGVQKMIRSDLAASGVMFSIDTESGFENAVLINSIYGLGENIVQGKVNPDEFYVFKPTGEIISRSLGKKRLRMIYSNDPANPVKDIKVSQKEQKSYSITDKQVKELAEWAMIIHKHYKRPMDMEWALDGKDGQLYIIQARPETVQSMRDVNVLEEYKIEKRGKVIISGQSVGNRIGSGIANRIMEIKDISKFKPGEVLITDMTDPDWEPIMKIASAIVTDKGGRTCHAAIVSRELGIPCVVGTERVSQKIKTGKKVTVSCAEGEEGYVYEGLIPFKINKTDVKNLGKPKTKIMLNIAEPDRAFLASFIPNDGVGLARLEFIINNSIKVHPLALINYAKQDAKVKKQIDKITEGYDNKKQFFIDKLSEGVAMIAAAFYPKDVIVRLSDFKSNEYANLIGGKAYEPVESNPMIGWRGANRYYTPKFLPAFELECKALRKVRDEMGLTNMKIMVPFCRTIEEGKKVLSIMGKTTTTSGMTEGQINRACEIFRAQLTKHASELPSEFVQQVFGQFELGPEWLAVIRNRVEAVSNMIVRCVRVDRSRSPQQVLDATGRVQHTDKSVVATMPKGEGEEVNVYFLKVGRSISNNDLEKKFDRHGLKPDPCAQAQVNIDDPAFADDHPNGTHWKDDKGRWCHVIFPSSINVHIVCIDRSDDGWNGSWWVGASASRVL